VCAQVAKAYGVSLRCLSSDRLGSIYTRKLPSCALFQRSTYFGMQYTARPVFGKESSATACLLPTFAAQALPSPCYFCQLWVASVLHRVAWEALHRRHTKWLSPGNYLGLRVEAETACLLQTRFVFGIQVFKIAVSSAGTCFVALELHMF